MHCDINSYIDSGKLYLIADEPQQIVDEMENSEFPDSDDFMFDMLDSMLANCALQWINPDEIGVLSEAPLLGIYRDDGTISQCFAFTKYMTTSVQKELAKRGIAVFTEI